MHLLKLSEYTFKICVFYYICILYEKLNSIELSCSILKYLGEGVLMSVIYLGMHPK